MAGHTFSTSTDPSLFWELDDGGRPVRLPEGTEVLVRDALSNGDLPGTIAKSLGHLNFTADVPGVRISGDGGASWRGPFWSAEVREQVLSSGPASLAALVDRDSGELLDAVVPGRLSEASLSGTYPPRDFVAATYSPVLAADVTVTVGTGGDYATISEALVALSRRRPAFVNGGLTAEVRLLAGFVMAEQVRVERIDLGWITITADDATVPIQRSALAVKYDRWRSAWRVSDGAVSPVVAVLFDMDTSGTSAADRVGFYVRNSSRIVFAPGAGCLNAAIRGIDCASASTMHGQETRWSGAGEIGVRVSNGSTAQLTQMVINGCGTVNLSVGGSCHVNTTQADLRDGLGRGLEVSGSSLVNADDVDVSGAALQGLYAHAGVVQFTGGKAQNCGGQGVLATGAAVVDADRRGTVPADVSGSAGGFLAEYGATINAGYALVNTCTEDAIKAQHGGRIVFNNGSADDCVKRALVADHGGFLAANFATGRRAGGVGLDVLKGSLAHAQNVDVSGAAATIGARAGDGSTIYFRGGNARRGASDAAGDITVTAGSSVTAHAATGGLSQAANTLSSNGVIYQ